MKTEPPSDGPVRITIEMGLDEYARWKGFQQRDAKMPQITIGSDRYAALLAIEKFCASRREFLWAGSPRTAANLPELLGATAGALDATSRESTLKPLLMGMARFILELLCDAKRAAEPAEGPSEDGDRWEEDAYKPPQHSAWWQANQDRVLTIVNSMIVGGMWMHLGANASPAPEAPGQVQLPWGEMVDFAAHIVRMVTGQAEEADP